MYIERTRTYELLFIWTSDVSFFLIILSTTQELNIFIKMSAILANLLSKIQSVHGLNEALKTAEKAKVFGLKQKAKQIFNVNFQ